MLALRKFRRFLAECARKETSPDPGFVLLTSVRAQQVLFHSPVRNLNCASVSGTTLSLPCRASGDSVNNLFDLASARVTGFGFALPTLIFTCGFFASDASTETTAAVPTALFSSPV